MYLGTSRWRGWKNEGKEKRKKGNMLSTSCRSGWRILSRSRYSFPLRGQMRSFPSVKSEFSSGSFPIFHLRPPLFSWVRRGSVFPRFYSRGSIVFSTLPRAEKAIKYTALTSQVYPPESGDFLISFLLAGVGSCINIGSPFIFNGTCLLLRRIFFCFETAAPQVADWVCSVMIRSCDNTGLMLHNEQAEH